MRAMILAAGYGKRLLPLTTTLPKVLLPVGEHPLIVHHLNKLSALPIDRVVINLGHLGELIEVYLTGTRPPHWEFEICYSKENPPLETGGGIKNALALLGNDPFIALSGDIYSDWDYQGFMDIAKHWQHLAHLLLSDNPSWHPKGDFGLHEGLVSYQHRPYFNFAGMAMYHPDFFNSPDHSFPLNDLFQRHIPQQRVAGSRLNAPWHNIGNLNQLNTLRAILEKNTEC